MNERDLAAITFPAWAKDLERSLAQATAVARHDHEALQQVAERLKAQVPDLRAFADYTNSQTGPASLALTLDEGTRGLRQDLGPVQGLFEHVDSPDEVQTLTA